MAKLKIYTFPDLVLTQKALPIQRVEAKYRKLADDMLETMYVSPGIGLAANQVGILERIIVLDTDYDYEELDEDEVPKPGGEIIGRHNVFGKNPRAMINPELIYKEGSILFEEGCLSVPEFNADVKRYEKVKIQYQDLDGLTKVLDADGLLAIAVQHEMDHLDGKLFIDRLSPLKKEMARKKLRKERAEREAAWMAGDFSGGAKSKKKGPQK
jgi:peptide deformylase